MSDAFERYFHRRADISDELANAGYVFEANVLSASSIDALGAIWLHDFPHDDAALQVELGGKVPASIRTARLLKRFASGDTLAPRVAVICFAEDWARHCPAAVGAATKLLQPRMGNRLPGFGGELPHSHEDVSRTALLNECPDIAANPKLMALVDEYEYGALLYRFYRCAMVHLGGTADRTHGFTRGEEVMYMRLKRDRDPTRAPKPTDDLTCISFGPQLITRWLRAAATGYMRHCVDKGVEPAKDIDPGQDAEDTLKGKWAQV